MYDRRSVLYVLVLTGGAATMALEMCASRLLAPYFGNSLPVWGLLVGLLLAYLAVGYSLGGRLADRSPQASLLYQLAAWAGVTIGLIPYLAAPIMRYSVAGFASYQAWAVLMTLLSVLALFAAPVLLLGCVLPFAVRLSVRDAASSGHVVGRLYALSTAGSLLGTFGSVFLLIPNLGTRRTIFMISVSLMSIAIVGLFQTVRRRTVVYILLLALIAALQLLPRQTIKPTEGVIYETESAYNYIQVLRNGEEVVLKLNEGEGIQSAYHPRQVLTGYVYDYFLLVPFFRSGPSSPPVSHLCIIGLAGGTTARQYTAVFGPIPIRGIEIDPTIVDVARRFFDLDLPNLDVVVQDGRHFLAHSSEVYDVVIVDAYRPPYIPFHLTTIEFFRDLRDHLSPDGVVAVNVARTETDYTLVDAIAGSLKAVYPSVYVMDVVSDLNSIVIATQQAGAVDLIAARLSGVSHPVLRSVALRATDRIREFRTLEGEVLTDDRAPVEQIVHAIVARYLWGRSPEVDEVHP